MKREVVARLWLERGILCWTAKQLASKTSKYEEFSQYVPVSVFEELKISSCQEFMLKKVEPRHEMMRGSYVTRL